MHTDMLITRFKERRAWACNDCRTYLFAKAQTAWRCHESWLGGGNMAKPLILFAFWDVMAGVYAHCQPLDSGLIWTVEQAEKVEGYKKKINEFIDKEAESEMLVKKLRLLEPRVNDILHAENALKVFLEEFKDVTLLGVEPKYFSHTVRPKYRNKLAHMYAPMLNGGTYSTSPSPEDFSEVLKCVKEHKGPVVLNENNIEMVNGVAMLRDTDTLANALIQNIQTSFTEDQAKSALNWLMQRI